MKLEKLNDNQIRCTLTREDLATRHLNLLELAYGSEKAKSLFREMMQQAAYEFGFEANDIPIMIEAIPTSDSLVLIITKVEDPEELDTRFAKFAPGGDSTADAQNSFSGIRLEGADDILNLLRRLKEAHKALLQKSEQDAEEPKHTEKAEPVINLIRLYCFDSLDDVIRAARVLAGSYTGKNSLYKHPESGEYYLFLSSSEHTPEEFNRICNTISEYGASSKYSAGTQAFLVEHGTSIITDEALQKLGQIP